MTFKYVEDNWPANQDRMQPMSDARPPDDAPTRLKPRTISDMLDCEGNESTLVVPWEQVRAEVSRLQQENALLKRSLGILERTISEAEGR